MTKEERQKRSEELKAERRAKVLQEKKAREEKEKEKVWLKSKEHKAVLKRAKELVSRIEPASVVVCAEDIPSNPESIPEPSTSRPTDPLQTSLVETGPQLLSLDPFARRRRANHPPHLYGSSQGHITNHQSRK